MGKQKKIILACDFNEKEQFQRIVDDLYPAIDIFKIGLESYLSIGPEAIEYVHQKGAKVFLDLKFHDIPNTVKQAAASAMRRGVFMFNVHAVGGLEMMTNARQMCEDLAREQGIAKPLLIGVTILTSMNENEMASVGMTGNPAQGVLRLASLTKAAGFDGVVASAHEITAIKAVCGEKFIVVTPGLRPAWAQLNDQKRVMTPGEAVACGADYLVIGRPITAADNPKEAADKILEEIS